MLVCSVNNASYGLPALLLPHIVYKQIGIHTYTDTHPVDSAPFYALRCVLALLTFSIGTAEEIVGGTAPDHIAYYVLLCSQKRRK